MPMPAIQRAEKLLLKISADLRTMQMQTYQIQDDLAGRIHQKYCGLTEIYKKNPNLEITKFGLKAFSFFAPNEIAKVELPETADAAGRSKPSR